MVVVTGADRRICVTVGIFGSPLRTHTQGSYRGRTPGQRIAPHERMLLPPRESSLVLAGERETDSAFRSGRSQSATIWHASVRLGTLYRYVGSYQL
ncbi:hypothetical protein GCM10023334_087180 [Nonomuraea thailandensis]